MVCKYRVAIERDESGAWIARVPSIPGCHTHGRTLEQARRRIREALALWVDDAGTAQLDFHVRLPRGVRAALRRSLADRERAESARAAAGLSTARAVCALVEELQLSVRDAGELLGLSHQRVQQLVRR